MFSLKHKQPLGSSVWTARRAHRPASLRRASSPKARRDESSRIFVARERGRVGLGGWQQDTCTGYIHTNCCGYDKRNENDISNSAVISACTLDSGHPFGQRPKEIYLLCATSPEPISQLQWALIILQQNPHRKRSGPAAPGIENHRGLVVHRHEARVGRGVPGRVIISLENGHFPKEKQRKIVVSLMSLVIAYSVVLMVASMASEMFVPTLHFSAMFVHL